MSGDDRHRCPDCGAPTTYQAFSGGREWWCEPCQMDGRYPDGEGPRRVQMLRAGRIDELKAEMRAALSDQGMLLAPTGPPRDPHAATMPWESFDASHPDHEDFVTSTGRCFAEHDCPYLSNGGSRVEGDRV